MSDKFGKGPSNSQFNPAATPLDVTIDRYLETGDDKVLKALYKPLPTEAARLEALTELSKQRFPDARSKVRAYVESGLQLPPPVGNAVEQFALQLSAAVQSPNKTALDYARERGDVEMTQLLLKAGADVNGSERTEKPAAKQNPPLKL